MLNNTDLHTHWPLSRFLTMRMIPMQAFVDVAVAAEALTAAIPSLSPRSLSSSYPYK